MMSFNPSNLNKAAGFASSNNNVSAAHGNSITGVDDPPPMSFGGKMLENVA